MIIDLIQLIITEFLLSPITIVMVIYYIPFFLSLIVGIIGKLALLLSPVFIVAITVFFFTQGGKLNIPKEWSFENIRFILEKMILGVANIPFLHLALYFITVVFILFLSMSLASPFLRVVYAFYPIIFLGCISCILKMRIRKKYILYFILFGILNGLLIHVGSMVGFPPAKTAKRDIEEMFIHTEKIDENSILSLYNATSFEKSIKANFFQDGSFLEFRKYYCTIAAKHRRDLLYFLDDFKNNPRIEYSIDKIFSKHSTIVSSIVTVNFFSIIFSIILIMWKIVLVIEKKIRYSDSDKSESSSS